MVILLLRYLGVLTPTTPNPTLIAECVGDEDEVLVELGQGLGNCVDVVGGGDHAACLLEPLEQLAACEETVVREKATEAICKAVDALDSAPAINKALLMLKRLCVAEWFTSRVSATSVFASMYPKLAGADAMKEIRG